MRFDVEDMAAVLATLRELRARRQRHLPEQNTGKARELSLSFMLQVEIHNSIMGAFNREDREQLHHRYTRIAVLAMEAMTLMTRPAPVEAGTFPEANFCWADGAEPEFFNELGFPTREAAAEAAQESHEVQRSGVFCTGVLNTMDISAAIPDAESLFERMNDHARDNVHGYDGDWPDVSTDRTSELDAILNPLVVAFLEEEGEIPNFGEVSQVQVHRLEHMPVDDSSVEP